ncbi:SusD/RagB family nutrient-binding outer membrane lipoprotein [Rudanella paleaurantiibacter]|uniref:SusD/RagB family nutrient-binding outer membrane lipoprotein n=1 Tax=Rudanella paleaurantiibacter TaxID=2614655 RepID=A0A7J5U326_9BACT|nr:SusD/RagB family nutrient-binding outer membrane lipoprotein [Rudanella paleaurantiibacter]KAB7732096.1 SusD/RagB family nutrient-binding outer membrane lipoprotein [Rudanella paleaurantiibacter]
MKKIHIYLLLTLTTFLATSCEKYLDVNTNPNQATSASAQLVLPQAIVGSAAITSQFNFNYGAHFGGYIANAGGFSGFGNLLNYNLVPGDYNFLWTNTYDNLQDYKYVLEQTDGKDDQAYYNAAARIMTALSYQRLVDAFNDVPYSEALKGNGNLAPKYDSGSAVYQDLINQLDQAIATINNAKFPLSLNSSSDPLFGGDMTRWKQFANTIKLRILIRMSGVAALSSFVTSKAAALDKNLGFLTADAIVNPGYVKDKPNPSWNTFGYSTTGTLANSSRISTQYVYGFYNGQKLTDPGRGSVLFKNFGVSNPATPINQLGNESNAPTVITNYSTWYTGTFSSASSISNALGVLKGPSQGQVLMLAAESSFLQAEGRLKGLLAGDPAVSFNQGITDSYTYLYKDVTNAVASNKNVATDVAKYKTDNAASYLVNFSLATTNDQKLEAIITQKYIAVAMINSEEGWNEYRRTGYPKTNPAGNGYTNIASNKSNSSRPDKLPTRVLYPSSEQSYNSANYKAINVFGDLIFWDPN